MGNPVVHFEISGQDPKNLREYYARLFGWEFDTDSPVAPSVSEAGNYGFMSNDDSIPGGLGGTRVMGPEGNPSGKLVVAHFRDPEGNLIGLAGPK
jgi:predicted enzyme related to lactoylglutathione lyase